MAHSTANRAFASSTTPVAGEARESAEHDVEQTPPALDSLPPAVARPVQWRRLYEQLAILRESDPAKVLDAAFSTGDAIGGMSEERLIRRVIATPEGRALCTRRPSLVDALADPVALASMPEGSLGRAFLIFSERHALEPRKLIERQHEMSRDFASLDPLRQWFSDRFTVMHDLWHVLAGYDATHAGESALMCFSLAHRINDRALPIFIAMSTLSRRISPRNAAEAIRRGMQSGFLVKQPFEELLPLPLVEVRERLGISAPRLAHPVVNSQDMLIPSAH